MAINQKDDRSKRIYCSELGSWFGASPFRSFASMLAQKAGFIEGDNLSGRPYIDAGNYLEEGLAKWYADVTNQRIVLPGDKEFVCAENDKLGGHVDVLVQPFDRSRKGCDIKYSTSDVFEVQEEWTGGKAEYVRWAQGNIPPYIWLQVHGYMAITGAMSWDIFAFLKNPPPILISVSADAGVRRSILRHVDKCWEMVEAARSNGISIVEPFIEGEELRQLARSIYNQCIEEQIILDDKLSGSIAVIKEAKAEIREINRHIRKLKDIVAKEEGKLLMAMGNYSRARCNGTQIQRKTVKMRTKEYQYQKLSMNSIETA